MLLPDFRASRLFLRLVSRERSRLIVELTNSSEFPGNLLVNALIIMVPDLVTDISKNDILEYDYSEYFIPPSKSGPLTTTHECRFHLVLGVEQRRKFRDPVQRHVGPIVNDTP